jgi:hypothetical protein
MGRDIEWDGAMRLKASGCLLEFVVEQPDFSVLIGGLDVDRDIRVEAHLVSDSP